MKKLLAVSTLAFLTSSLMMADPLISIKNTLGGDGDNVGGGEFIEFDKNGNRTKGVSVNDRIEMDLKGDKVEGRARLDIETGALDNNNDPKYYEKNALNGKLATTRLRGYVNVKPCDYVNLVAGNYFFTKFVIPSAYLGATDDTTVNARPFGENGYGLLLKKDSIKATASFTGEDECVMNFSLDYTDKTFGVGATIQDAFMSSKEGSTGRTINVFSQYTGIENLRFAVGYMYNYQSGADNFTAKAGSLPGTSDSAKYGANGVPATGTEHAIQATVGYKMPEKGLELYADFITGLNKKAVLNKDFNNKDRGDTVDASDIKLPGDDYVVPMGAALRLNYKIKDDLTFKCKYFLGRSSYIDSTIKTTTYNTIYPNVEYKTDFGSFVTGVRFKLDDKQGIRSVQVPLSWTVKLTNAK